MGQPRVVIVSSRSLFVEGIATRLQQQLGAHEIYTVDARNDDTLAHVIGANPSIVILDATDDEVDERCPLGALLDALPKVKIIRLDPQRDQIQLLTSEQRTAGQVSDLIDVIRSAA